MKVFRHSRTGTVHAAPDGHAWSYCGLANSKAGSSGGLDEKAVNCLACLKYLERHGKE